MDGEVQNERPLERNFITFKAATGYGSVTKVLSLLNYSHLSSNMDFSNTGFIIHMKINANNYLLNTENSFMCGLPKML